MLTPFGKEVRRLRLGSSEITKLKDLADALGVTSAYLSAIETGKKTPSTALVDNIANAFKADPATRRALHQAAANSTKNIQLHLATASPKARELATAFARRFSSLDESQVEVLLGAIEQAAPATSSHEAFKIGRKK